MLLRPALITVAAAALAATALTACHTAGSGGGGSDDKVTLMVGGLSKVIYMPAELTAQLGYFKAEGLDVTLQDTPAGVTAETALVGGQVNGVVGFYDHTIDLQTKGKCIQSVVQFANVPGEVEVVSKKQASSITSPADFKGKKLGITSAGSSTDFLTQYLSGQAGVPAKDYTTVNAGAGQTFIAALQNGGIDAGMTTDPTVAQLQKTGAASILLDMRTVAGTQKALGGLYPASSLYMDCAYVSKHAKTVQKLANAFVKTLKFINTHDAAAIAAKMPKDFAGGDSTLYERAITNSKGMFNNTGVMDPAGAQNVLTVLSKFSPNVKGKASSIDLSKTYTTRFAQAAGQ